MHMLYSVRGVTIRWNISTDREDVNRYRVCKHYQQLSDGVTAETGRRGTTRCPFAAPTYSVNFKQDICL